MTNSSPYRRRLLVVSIFILLIPTINIAQKRRVPQGGRLAVVVDERLSALRDRPALDGALVRRVSRGGFVAIRECRRSLDGILFCHANVTSRTRGWIQRDALVSKIKGDDSKLLRLIVSSEGFDRIARAKIFLDLYPNSSLRSAVLLMLGDAAEAVSEKLSREASRRLSENELNSQALPEFAYFLNYSGLDRYNRQGVRFVFDREGRRFHYAGTAWREIIKRYPHSPEAIEARLRLNAEAKIMSAK